MLVSSHEYLSTWHSFIPLAFLPMSPAGQLHLRSQTPLLFSLMLDFYGLEKCPIPHSLVRIGSRKKSESNVSSPPQVAAYDMLPENNYFTYMYISKDLNTPGISVPYILGFNVSFQVQVNPHEKDNKSTLHISL